MLEDKKYQLSNTSTEAGSRLKRHSNLFLPTPIKIHPELMEWLR